MFEQIAGDQPVSVPTGAGAGNVDRREHAAAASAANAMWVLRSLPAEQPGHVRGAQERVEGRLGSRARAMWSGHSLPTVSSRTFRKGGGFGRIRVQISGSAPSAYSRPRGRMFK